MRTLLQSFAVHFQYPVHFTSDLFASHNLLLAQLLTEAGQAPHKVLCVLDQGVLKSCPAVLDQIESYGRAHPGVMKLVGAPIVVPGGETVKNTPRYWKVLQAAVHQFGICRQSFLLAVGGGAVLDMAGFAAATAHRGIRLIRVPSTVLAQNDSGVGVKNSINAFGKKINDFSLLARLPDRDWLAGTAEAVKVGLIKDSDFFLFLEDNAERIVSRDAATMQHLVYRCAELHLQHIATAGDPFESGSSRPLDFGHWAAHKLEQLTNFRLRHGEAVAIGIALDSTYSYLAGLLPEQDWSRILALLSRLGFAFYVPELEEHLEPMNDPGSLSHGLIEFREHLGGQLTLMLLEGIGKPLEVHELDMRKLQSALNILAQSRCATALCAA